MIQRLAQRTAGSPERFDRRLIAPMLLGSVLNPINSSIIAVSLVPIGAAFGAPPARTAWLVSALYLATAIGQPVVGRLVDLYGPRRLYLAGTGLTGAAGILGMVAPNLGVLIASRVVLGFGTCAGYPAAMSLVRSEATRTGQESPSGVLTALSVANQTVAVIGPTLGGLLIGLGGWRSTFAVNIPLSAACLVLGTLRLPRQAGEAAAKKTATRLDIAGMALFAAMLITLLLFLTTPRTGHLYLLAITALAGAGLVIRESRTATPFIDLRVLAGNPALLSTYGRCLLAYVVSYAFLFGFTQWLEDGRSLSASHAGLVLMPMFLAGIVVATVSGRRSGIRGKLVAGALGQVAACAMLLTLGSGTAVWLLVAVALVMGVPQGLNGLALQNSVYRQADPPRLASSAGLMRTFMYLGAIISAAANGAFLRDRADTSGLHHLAWFMLAVSVVLFAATLLDRSLHGLTLSTERKPMALSTLDPRTALVLIDLQKGIVAAPTAPYTGPEVVARAAKLANAFRAHGAPVVLVRVTTAPDGSDATPGRTEAPPRTGNRPPGWDTIVDDLAGHPGDITVTKRNWGAFYGTDLDLQLRRRGITQIVLGGVATSIGVESTARAAYEHGYHVTFATDAMADRDPESHRHSVERIFPRLGETGTTAEIIELLAKSRAA
jgi:nicotinamidase-related amidase/predicted MFS family arabinose efflux permease